MSQPATHPPAEFLAKSLKPAFNSPAWLEIPCSSVPRARQFYTSVFGWSFGSPPPGFSSESFHPFKIAGSTITGGLRKSEDAEGDGGKKDGIVVHLRVEDVDATLKKVVESGGKVKLAKIVQGEREHTEMGSFWDTEGNVVWILTLLA